MRFLFVIMLVALLGVGGCSFKVINTDGIKRMLEKKTSAEKSRSDVETKYTGNNKETLKNLYNEACTANNGWIKGIQNDVAIKTELNVSEDDYRNSNAYTTSTDFITATQKEVGFYGTRSIDPITVAAITAIIDYLWKRNQEALEAARALIKAELEKNKWEQWK
jgi:hypothetical protein